ncbi:MAG: hypothetical protein ACOCYE_12255 [Pseudomonadota bacterium]
MESLLEFDRAYAMAPLPDLLATPAERERAVAIARELASWRPGLVPEVEEVPAEFETLLGVRAVGHQAA